MLYEVIYHADLGSCWSGVLEPVQYRVQMCPDFGWDIVNIPPNS